MKSETVVFDLTIAEANLIFKALGKLPFEEVYELIGKLNTQANQQLKTDQNYSDINFNDNSTQPN